MHHNFKYHSNSELDDLAENLRKEITVLKAVSELNSIQDALLKEDEEMLRAIEFELLERTILG
jgi:hypothetical protein